MVHWTWTSLSFLVQSTGRVLSYSFAALSPLILADLFGVFWDMFGVCIGWLDDWIGWFWFWSQGSRPTWCHIHASTSCWPPMHQLSLQRRHTMSSCPWQRSPCLSSSQPPWWWSVILATASTWPAAWCTAAARQKVARGKMFVLRKFTAGEILVDNSFFL